MGVAIDRDRKRTFKVEVLTLDWVPKGHAAGPIAELFVFMMAFILMIPAYLARAKGFGLATLGIGTVGFAMFSAAKFSMYRRGIWFSWGSSLMTSEYRKLYRIGCALLVCSAIMSLVIIKVGIPE